MSAIAHERLPAADERVVQVVADPATRAIDESRRRRAQWPRTNCAESVFSSRVAEVVAVRLSQDSQQVTPFVL
jgi:hypothetical protein